LVLVIRVSYVGSSFVSQKLEFTAFSAGSLQSTLQLGDPFVLTRFE